MVMAVLTGIVGALEPRSQQRRLLYGVAAFRKDSPCSAMTAGVIFGVVGTFVRDFCAVSRGTFKVLVLIHIQLLLDEGRASKVLLYDSF